MLVVLVLAALAVLAGVVLVATGRGGELKEFAPDVPPLALPAAGQLTAVDFMALQLPVSLVGYHTQSVDETLQRAATALSERDTRIAVLEQRVSELLASRLQARQEMHAGPAYGPVTEHRPGAPREDLAESREDAAPVPASLGDLDDLEEPEEPGGQEDPGDPEEPEGAGARRGAEGAGSEEAAEKGPRDDPAGPDGEPGAASARRAGGPADEEGRG
ncbi:hypothetical protein HS048_33625 [Planomonospora sp. ID91781]|uniref:hypothetical protein n=1 Tax=Planomonospora sp. ID91781 TaxID=2738135 RepID=UPI0018C41528|nr:hypothetical protein [Planomonospora sp. ID91781]MBG0825628.1 hypothetical protein [Planomonospora sp. ID91781]